MVVSYCVFIHAEPGCCVVWVRSSRECESESGVAGRTSILSSQSENKEPISNRSFSHRKHMYFKHLAIPERDMVVDRWTQEQRRFAKTDVPIEVMSQIFVRYVPLDSDLK